MDYEKIVVRKKVNELGQISIPFQFKRALNLKEKDEVDLFLKGKEIILKKVKEDCFICHNEKEEELKEFKNLTFCINCIKKLTQISNI